MTVTARSSRDHNVIEEDIESAGRSSEDLEERDAFLDQKRPIASIRTRSLLQSDDSCPICLRQSRWRRLLKRRESRCAHDKAAINDYLKLCRKAPVAIIRRRRCRLLSSFILVIFAMFGFWNLITLFIGLGPLIWDPSLAVDHFFPNWGMPGEPGEYTHGYPTDFTRDVEPMPCHSHNDYWRRIPLFEALHYGCTGVEADVWLFDEELFVGHTTASLSPNRTLKTLYVDPLVKIIESMNPKPLYSTASAPSQINGVFEEGPLQTLVLLIDFKMDGRKQFPYVSSHLEALRSRKYLTHYNGTHLIEGPVTVVATGNAPFDLLTANTTYRDIFFDAPLDKLSDSPKSSRQKRNFALGYSDTTAGQGETGTNPAKGAAQFTSESSYYASVNFKSAIGFPWRGRLSHKQMRKLRSQIKHAHDKGLKARYWDTPTWPVGLRNHIWKILIEEGVDYLNVDDLRSAKMVDWDRSWRRNRWLGGI